MKETNYRNPYIAPGIDRNIIVSPKKNEQILRTLVRGAILNLQQYSQFSEDALFKAVNGRSRKREIVRIRQIFCHIYKRIYKHATLAHVASYISHVDHSTVIHSIKTVDNDMAVRKYREDYNTLFNFVISHTQ